MGDKGLAAGAGDYPDAWVEGIDYGVSQTFDESLTCVVEVAEGKKLTGESLDTLVTSLLNFDDPAYDVRVVQIRLAKLLGEHFLRSGDEHALQQAMDLMMRVQAGSHLPQPSVMLELARLRSEAGRRLRRPALLSEAIQNLDSIKTGPACDSALEQEVLQASWRAHTWRAELTRSDQDWLSAASAAIRLIEVAEVGDPYISSHEQAAARALLEHYEITKQVDSLKDAIERLRRCLTDSSAPRAHIAQACYLLGRALRFRGQRSGSVLDLNEAVIILERAVVESDFTDEDIMAYLSNQAFAYLARYEVTMEISDLDEALRALARSFSATLDPVKAEHRLANLFNVLSLRIRRGGFELELLSHLALLESRLTRKYDPALAGWWLLHLEVEAYIRAYDSQSSHDLLLAMLLLKRCAYLIPDDVTSFEDIEVPAGAQLKPGSFISSLQTFKEVSAKSAGIRFAPTDTFPDVLGALVEDIRTDLVNSGLSADEIDACSFEYSYDLALFVHLDNLGDTHV